MNNTGSAATSYTDTGALSGQKHIYRVGALGSGGAGQQSPPVEIVIPTETPTATATSTPTATPTPAPEPGCVNVGPGAYWLFPTNSFLSGTITVHDSDQCDSTGTTQDIGADGYVYTSGGQSAAASLCSAGQGGGAYQAQQQAFNTELWACAAMPTDTPVPTDTDDSANQTRRFRRRTRRRHSSSSRTRPSQLRDARTT